MACSVFLTGATGYVGRHVLIELARRGHRTTCLVRSAEAALRLQRDGHSAVVGHLSAPLSWMETAMNCDAVIHTAFPYSEAGEELAGVETTFVRELLQFLARKQQAPHFIYTSSLFLFGAVGHCAPFSELDAPPLERTAWRLGLEHEVLGDGQERGRTTVVRLGWVYGGNGGTLRQAIAGNSLDTVERSKLRVPLIHVDDLARLYALAFELRIAGLLHACEPTPLTWCEIIRVVQSTEQSPPATVSQVGSRFLEIDRPARPARSIEFGWIPSRRFTSDFQQPVRADSRG